MKRSLIIILLISLLTPLRSEQKGEEPEQHGKKLSEWIRQLDSSDVGIRNNAASVLISFGDAAAPAAPSLARLLQKDDNADVRRHAALALGAIGPKANAAATALSKAASKDSNPSVRVCAAQSLAGVDPAKTEAAVEALRKLVTRGNGGFDRINAAAALGALGAKAQKALPELKVAAQDSEPQVAKAAREALKKIEPKL